MESGAFRVKAQLGDDLVPHVDGQMVCNGQRDTNTHHML